MPSHYDALDRDSERIHDAPFMTAPWVVYAFEAQLLRAMGEDQTQILLGHGLNTNSGTRSLEVLFFSSAQR